MVKTTLNERNKLIMKITQEDELKLQKKTKTLMDKSETKKDYSKIKIKNQHHMKTHTY